MRSHTTSQAQSGFTLVEVLLAVTILGLVITAVYATWSASLMAWRRGGDASDIFQRQRVVMDALTELTQSVVFFSASPAFYTIRGVNNPGLGSSVSFVTASDALLPSSEAIAAGMRRVTISLEKDEYGRKYLAILNAPALSTNEANAELQAHVLSMDVSGFYVRYLDPRDATWHDTWDDGNIIPLGMEFTVMFGEQGDRLPPAVVTRGVDLPIADFIAQGSGVQVDQEGLTNEVQRQDIGNLSESRQNNAGQSSLPPGLPPLPLP